MPKYVVIVGGGFAGVECARRLERQLPSDWQIVLFNSVNHTTFTPLLAEVVGSSISPVHVVWNIRQTLRHTVCHTAEIGHLDFAAHEVEYKLTGGRVGRQKYDQLILASGMVVNTDVLPGAAMHSFPLKTLGDALVLRNHLIDRLERAEVEPDADRRRQLASFLILGGGFSGIEVAGEIWDLLVEALPFYRSLRRSDLHVTVVHAGERILPELPAVLAEYAARAHGRPRHRDPGQNAGGGGHPNGNSIGRRDGHSRGDRSLHDRQRNRAVDCEVRIAPGTRTNPDRCRHEGPRQRQCVGHGRLRPGAECV